MGIGGSPFCTQSVGQLVGTHAPRTGDSDCQQSANIAKTTLLAAYHVAVHKGGVLPSQAPALADYAQFGAQRGCVVRTPLVTGEPAAAAPALLARGRRQAARHAHRWVAQERRRKTLERELGQMSQLGWQLEKTTCTNCLSL
jgi:hypothetical protein